MKDIERVRWRCRRGLLELDIVLERFVETRYEGLDESQRAAFDALLDMPDTILWDMIAGRTPPLQREQNAVIGMINAA
jgi:antitoxin CptB